LSGVVPVYLYYPAFIVSVSRPNVSGTCGQAVQQPTNMQPGTFCYR